MAGHYLMVTDPRATQRLLLYRVACCRGTPMMSASLILDRVARLAFTIHQQQIDSFRIDAPVGLRVLAAKDLAQRNLSHHLPSWIAVDHDLVERLKYPCLASIKNRSNDEVCAHDNPQLIRCVRLLKRGQVSRRK